MNIKKLILFISAVLMVVACTKNEGTYNHHSAAPGAGQDKDSVLQVSSMVEAAQAIENFRGPAYNELESFFKKYITKEFFLKYQVEKNIDDLSALMKFHLRFLVEAHRDNSNKDKFAQLSFEYYQFIKNLCQGDFSSCHYASIYARSVYAGEVFLLAENLISGAEKETYIQFVTQIGFPENGIERLNKRLEASIEKLNQGLITDKNELKSLLNLIYYVSAKTKKVQVEAISSVLKYSRIHFNDYALRIKVENILTLNMDNNNSAELTQLADDYIKRLVRSHSIYRFMNKKTEGNLIKGQYDEVAQKYINNIELYYSLIGLIKSDYAGQLHSYNTHKIIKDQKSKDSLLELVRSYLFKKMVSQVYKSHEIMGDIMTTELKKYVKVEAIFGEYFGKVDAELANIWANDYKGDVIFLEKGIAQFYTGEELKEIRRLISHLDMNIRNLVMYPSLFILGYHAVKQGDFNLRFPGPQNTVLNVNDQVFFNELIQGTLPSFFQFLNANSATAQENIFALYFSMDKKILNSYGIGFDFLEAFINRYVHEEHRFLINRTIHIDNFFGPQTVASDMKTRCEKLSKGNYNFTFEKNFSFFENNYFFGDVYYVGNGNIANGTTYEMRDYVLFFNNLAMKETLSESLAMLRLDLGPKINHLRIIRQALLEQSKMAEAAKVKRLTDKLLMLSDRYVAKVEKYFKETTDCILKHSKVESDMRKHFFNREKSYAESTYAALKLLNKYDSDEVDVSRVRSENPEDFKREYLKDLPQSGDFLHLVSQKWLSITKPIKKDISDYVSEVESQIGFEKNAAGKFVLKTNFYEDYFRKMVFVSESSVAGIKFPMPEFIEIPKTSKQLDIIFGDKEDHYYNWKIGESDIDVDKFVFKIFDSVHGGDRKRGTDYELDGTLVWRYILMNYSGLLKFKAHREFLDDSNYETYKTKLDNKLVDNYNYMAELTDKILKSMNVDQEEAQILTMLRHTNFYRSEHGTLPGNYLFFHHSGIEFKNLGKYDMFFSTLSSYRLGEDAIFRKGMYGTAAQNPLTAQFDYKPTSQNSEKEIGSRELIRRRDPLLFSKANFLIAQEWDERILFKLNDRSREIIQHDLFHPIHADHALTDSFMDWVNLNTTQSANTIPYRLDLFRHGEGQAPVLLLPTLVDRYQDTRSKFHSETGNIFKLNKSHH